MKLEGVVIHFEIIFLVCDIWHFTFIYSLVEHRCWLNINKLELFINYERERQTDRERGRKKQNLINDRKI